LLQTLVVAFQRVAPALVEAAAVAHAWEPERVMRPRLRLWMRLWLQLRLRG